ncbi:hypothetical protein L6Q79_06530 [bacterium]|nr:hypothetical protein [bacterium]NUN46047.1 hypothetical protein [bacterium]
MRKVIFLCLVALLMQDQLSAQTSVGFSDNNPKPIKDYRLPDWGYSRGWINASLSRNNSSSDYSDEEYKNDNSSYWLNSNYILMRESEKQDLNFSASAFYSKRTNETSRNNDLGHSDRDYNDIVAHVMLRGNSSHYAGYYHATILPHIAYTKSESVYKVTDIGYMFPDTAIMRSKEKSNAIDLSLATLFGIGRIRNVTPVIRAMRVHERLNAVGKGESWNEETTQRVAAEFARLYGYQNVYDRHQKEFWNSLDEALPDLTPFEAHYMNDVFQEAIGNRLEGYVIDVGPRIIRYQSRDKRNSSNYYLDDEDVKFRSTYLGMMLNGQFYHNYSINGQIDFSATGSLDFRSSSKKYNPVSDLKQMQLAVNHLYSIADRLLWTVSGTYDNAHIKIGDEDTHETFKSKKYKISTNLTYFIENRLSISGDAAWLKKKNSPASDLNGYYDMGAMEAIRFVNSGNLFDPYNGVKSSKQWYYGISLTYHFNRTLL